MNVWFVVQDLQRFAVWMSTLKDHTIQKRMCFVLKTVERHLPAKLPLKNIYYLTDHNTNGHFGVNFVENDFKLELIYQSITKHRCTKMIPGFRSKAHRNGLI